MYDPLNYRIVEIHGKETIKSTHSNEDLNYFMRWDLLAVAVVPVVVQMMALIRQCDQIPCDHSKVLHLGNAVYLLQKAQYELTFQPY
jgi:hypothetical protein